MRTYTIGPARRIFHRAVSWLYPPACPVCMNFTLWKPGSTDVCPDCREKLLRIHPPFCSRCGRPFQSETAHECSDCLKNPPPFQKMRSPFVYDGPLRKAILSFKMHPEPARAPYLGALLLETERLGIDWESYDLVVPVPLHPNRLKKRGFNQCALMIAQIAKMRKIEWATDLLVRIKDTRPQFELKPSQRKKNVSGAFDCNCPENWAGAKILLVDDITTTGSTLIECAKVLKKKTAASIDAAVLSRVVDLS